MTHLSFRSFLASRPAKIAGALFLLILLAGMTLTARSAREESLQETAQQLERAVSELASSAEAGLLYRRRGISFLAQTPPIEGMRRAIENGGMDPAENSSLTQWRSRLQRIFVAYIGANPDVYQARYIGVADGGRELVRVERRGADVVAAGDEALQKKADRDYFQATLRLPSNETFISEINLNQERGRIELPHRPTARAAAPVYNDAGQVFGIVVINVDTHEHLQRYAALAPKGATIYVTNAEGDFLVHPDPARTFRVDLGRRHRWQDEFTDTGVTGNGLKIYEGAQSRIYTAARVVLRNPYDPDRALRFIAAMPERTVFAEVGTRLAQVGAIMVFAGLLALLVLYVYWRAAHRDHEAQRQVLQLAEQEQRLAREQESFYKGVINASPQAILVVDDSGAIIEANHHVLSIFGYSPEQMIGKTIEVLLPQAARARHAGLRAGYDRQVRRMGARMDLKAMHADGHEFPVEVLLSPLVLNERKLVVASVVDVTEQRQAAERLRLSEARWRELANSMPQLVWTCAADGGCDYLSQRWAEYTGLPVEPQLGSGWIEQVHADDREALAQRWQEAVRSAEVFFTEFRIRRHDGAYRWFDTRAVPLLDDAGRVVRWIGSNTDVEARKQVEQQLQALNTTLESQVIERTAQLEAAASLQRAILTHAGYSIIATRVDGIITLFNPAAEQMLGYRAAEMVGLQTPAIIHDPAEVTARAAELSQELQQMIAPSFEAFVAVARKQASEEREWTYLRRDGVRLPVRLKVSALRGLDGGIVGFLGIAVDLTEQHRREAELLASRQRVETSMLQLQLQHQDMTVFAEFSGILQACIALDEIHAPVRRYLRLLFPQCAGALYLMQTSRNHLEQVLQWGSATSSQALFDPQSCWALRRGQMHLRLAPDDLCCTHIGKEDAHGSLCLPMMAQNETLGLLYLDAQLEEAAVLERNQALARMVAERIGMTIANLRLRDSLRQQSIRDTLTQLYNRRYLEETMQRELAAAQRAGSSVAVLMLDVDHFKKFNDRHGHEAGDQALRALARQLEKSCRSSDIACRYGGEEFTLVLTHVTAEQALARAQELCSNVRAQELHVHGQSLGRITVSIGVALFPQHGTNLQVLQEVADRALYRAKSEGRDRVVLSEEVAQD